MDLNFHGALTFHVGHPASRSCTALRRRLTHLLLLILFTVSPQRMRAPSGCGDLASLAHCHIPVHIAASGMQEVINKHLFIDRSKEKPWRGQGGAAFKASPSPAPAGLSAASVLLLMFRTEHRALTIARVGDVSQDSSSFWNVRLLPKVSIFVLSNEKVLTGNILSVFP